jgi:hypothetical protein
LAYDETLCRRVRDLLGARTAFAETNLMGGLVFMVDGNMCCGVTGSSLLVRVGEAARNGALAKPHTRRMEFGGRSPKGFIFVDAKGCADRQGAARLGAARPRLCCDAAAERKARSVNQAEGMKAAAFSKAPAA